MAQIEPDLSEWDYGDYEGLRTAEIQQQHPGWDIWEDGCPGGDMPIDAATRADRLIARLCRWIGLSARQGQHFALDPASISVLGFEKDHPQRRVIARRSAEADWSWPWSTRFYGELSAYFAAGAAGHRPSGNSCSRPAPVTRSARNLTYQ